MTYSYSAVINTVSTPGTEHYDVVLERLIHEVTSLFGIDRKHIYEHGRRERVKYCRWIIWEIMWGTQNLTLKETAAILNKDAPYDHSTIIHALRELPAILQTNEFVRQVYETVMIKCMVDRSAINNRRYEQESLRESYDKRPLSGKSLREKCNRIRRQKLRK